MTQASGIAAVGCLGRKRRDDANRLHDQPARLAVPTFGLVLNGLLSHASGYRRYAGYSSKPTHADTGRDRMSLHPARQDHGAESVAHTDAVQLAQQR
jgi:hypothetical protein